MDLEKKEIIICLGSSCFARGNKELVKLISKYLRQRSLQNEVRFHGERCFGHCAKGPTLKIDSILHEKVDEERVIQLLDSFFASLEFKAN